MTGNPPAFTQTETQNTTIMLLLTRITLLLALLTPLEGFVTTTGRSAASKAAFDAKPLYGKYDPYGRGGDSSSSRGDDAFERNKARTDLRNFLTQRSVQSFVYLLNQVRDEQTVRWIEDTIDFKKIDSFHGTGAFNTTLFPSWDSYFLDLVTRPVDTVVVTIKKRERRRGFGPSYMDNLSNSGSSNAKNEKKTTTSPAKTPKPLPRRPGFGIGGSYLDNLGGKKTTNAKATDDDKSEKKNKNKKQPKKQRLPERKKPTPPGGMGSYLENLSNAAKSEPEQPKKKKASFEKPRKNPFMEEKTIEYEIDIDPASLLTRMISVREQISKEWSLDLDTLITTNDQILVSYANHQKEARAADEEDEDEAFDDDDDDEDEDDIKVEDLTAPYSDHSEKEEVVVFDKDAMVMLTNSISNQGKDSSPFRRSNFDLLVLLSTQESVHRLLRQYMEEDERGESFEWLREFYTDRVKDYFDGHQVGYGNADKFLEELLLAPPSILQKGSDVQFIDPMKMAEDIIKMRSDVAREWKEIVSEAPKEHVDLRRLLLTRRMMEGAESNPLDTIVGTIVEETTSTPKKSKTTKTTGAVFESGAFE